jgi:hypothetical protein
MSHDLQGLENFLALAFPLEDALQRLYDYRLSLGEELRPKEREGLDATIRSLALTLQTLYDRPEKEPMP